MKVEEKYNATEQKYLYNLSFKGCYIGFALEKNVFKKLMKLNAKYTAEVKEILCGEFSNEQDRQYWIDKLNELERKEVTNKENEKYFRAMAKYAR